MEIVSEDERTRQSLNDREVIHNLRGGVMVELVFPNECKRNCATANNTQRFSLCMLDYSLLKAQRASSGRFEQLGVERV